MIVFTIIILAIVALAALLTVLGLAATLDEYVKAKTAPVVLDFDNDVRQAERRLHEIAGASFVAMLEEARTRGRGSVK